MCHWKHNHWVRLCCFKMYYYWLFYNDSLNFYSKIYIFLCWIASRIVQLKKSMILCYFAILSKKVNIMSRAMQILKFFYCVTEHVFIHEFIFSTWLIYTLLFSYVFMHSYHSLTLVHALVHTVLMIIHNPCEKRKNLFVELTGNCSWVYLIPCWCSFILLEFPAKLPVGTCMDFQ